MDPTGTTARRFPLIARPRPACTPLGRRAANLRQLAINAERLQDIAKATAAFNLSALIASDCGLPELARRWCHQLARTTLLHHPADARLGLEPIVNLARLRTRAGDGLGAWQLLNNLYRAVESRTDTNIDGIDIRITELTADPNKHSDLRKWLWSVLLADGSRALATAGHWQPAYRKLKTLHGIGQRILDGRQIAVLAHLTTGNHHLALHLLRETDSGQPWENAVVACLTLYCQPNDLASAGTPEALMHYEALDPTTVGPVFRIRLGLCLLDRIRGLRPTILSDFKTNLINDAATDGYAARDVLYDPECCASATEHQRCTLTELVTTCGLDQGAIPTNILTELATTLGIAEAVITTARP